MSERVRILGAPATVGRLTRRSVLFGMAAAGIALVTGCGQDGRRVASNVAPDGEIESKLNVYSWGDYDDPDLLKAFGREFDLVLQVDSFGSNEELMAKLAASRGTSGYDVVVPSGLVIPQMVEHQLLQPLDHSLIPNLSTIDPAFLKQDFDPENTYSVCKNWGVTGYVYDNTVISGSPATWRDFVELAQGPASGNVSLLEDPWEVCAIGLGAEEQDLNTTDGSVLDACERVVVDQLAPHVKAYAGSATTSMTQGGFTLLHAYNGDARQGILEDDDPDRWTFVYPTPSLNLWMDTWAIATGAPHPDAAHAFIDYIIAPEQARAEADYIGYPTGSEIFSDPAVEQEFDFPELIFPTRDVLDRTTSQVFNSGQQRRVEIFTSAQARSGA